MVAPSLSLHGKLALVTGARRGIGKAITLRFAEAGADVAVCDFVADTELDQVAEKIIKQGRRSLAQQVDVREKVSVNNMVELVEKKLGDIDVLVNAAGVLNISPLVDLPEEAWDRVIDTNLKGTFLCCQALASKMIHRRRGAIINIASIDGFNPVPYQVAYNCSKVGVRMLTSILAFELARYNIRVNAVAPGWIRTKMTEYLDYSPSDKAAVLNDIAMGRLGDPGEIANVALFLASDLASYASGATWRVDGAVNPCSLAVVPKEMAKNSKL